MNERSAPFLTNPFPHTPQSEAYIFEWAISPFVTILFKDRLLQRRRKEFFMKERNNLHLTFFVFFVEDDYDKKWLLHFQIVVRTCVRMATYDTFKTVGWIFNTFPHIDAFWRICSRGFFENIVTIEEIAQNEQFLLLPQCFPLLVVGFPFNYRDFPFLDKICSKSSAAVLSYGGKG